MPLPPNLNALLPAGVQSNFEGQFPTAPGQMGIGGAPNGNTGIVPPSSPVPQGGHMGHGDFRNALMDWRALRPDHQGFTGTPMEWRQQMMDWRGQRPDRPDGRVINAQQVAAGLGGAPVTQIAPVPTGQLPPNPTGQLPPNPAAVSNPYQLPSY